MKNTWHTTINLVVNSIILIKYSLDIKLIIAIVKLLYWFQKY